MVEPSAVNPCRRILLTGSAGAIGRCVGPALVAAGHEVRGFDLVPSPELADHMVGDLTDPDTLDRAIADRDTVIHLAAYPNPAPFLETLLKPNVVALYQVVDAVKRHGLPRLILASSIHVVTGLRRAHPERTCTADDAAPINDYGLAKLWAEQLGAMAARTTADLQVLAIRIGWFVRNAQEARRLAGMPRSHPIYLSWADTERFFVRAVEADLTGLPDDFAVLYANGPQSAPGNDPGTDPKSSPPPHIDLEPARRWLGYAPRDRFPAGLPASYLES